MPASRTQPAPLTNPHTEGVLALMESIAETIPDAVAFARMESWEAAVHEALILGMITEAQADVLDGLNPNRRFRRGVPARHAAEVS